MAKDKKVEAITSQEDDFAQWYTDICRKAELVEYASVKGFIILRPYGFAIWENIQKFGWPEFKKTGHENVAMPVLIPESLLKKEGELVNGFAPEVAWVTMGGSEKLEERLAFRPTSETMFCDHWSRVLHTYRQLPMLYNQWCSVIRWEKTTRPFLRTREFWWQEGHTIHETAEEAEAETEQQLNCYADFFRKRARHPRRQGPQDREGEVCRRRGHLHHRVHDEGPQGPAERHQPLLWRQVHPRLRRDLHRPRQQAAVPVPDLLGRSTRMIGAIIMTHGDNDGLVLPPRIAPIQVVVPIAAHKPGVSSQERRELAERSAAGPRQAGRQRQLPRLEVRRVRDEGRALRLEIGPKDLRRTSASWSAATPAKRRLSLGRSWRPPSPLLEALRKDLYERALENRKKHLGCHHHGRGQGAGQGQHRLHQDHVVRRSGLRDEDEGEAGLSSRCMPFEQEQDHGLLGCGLLRFSR